MNLTFEEVEQDRQASARDLEYLASITNGIRSFMNNPCGENRTAFKKDLLVWESLFAQCSSLHEKILAKHQELRPK